MIKNVGQAASSSNLSPTAPKDSLAPTVQQNVFFAGMHFFSPETKPLSPRENFITLMSNILPEEECSREKLGAILADITYFFYFQLTNNCHAFRTNYNFSYTSLILVTYYLYKTVTQIDPTHVKAKLYLENLENNCGQVLKEHQRYNANSLEDKACLIDKSYFISRLDDLFDELSAQIPEEKLDRLINVLFGYTIKEFAKNNTLSKDSIDQIKQIYNHNTQRHGILKWSQVFKSNSITSIDQNLQCNTEASLPLKEKEEKKEKKVSFENTVTVRTLFFAPETKALTPQEKFITSMSHIFPEKMYTPEKLGHVLAHITHFFNFHLVKKNFLALNAKYNFKYDLLVLLTYDLYKAVIQINPVNKNANLYLKKLQDNKKTGKIIKDHQKQFPDSLADERCPTKDRAYFISKLNDLLTKLSMQVPENT